MSAEYPAATIRLGCLSEDHYPPRGPLSPEFSDAVNGLNFCMEAIRSG